VRLSGTITCPDTASPSPGVVLIGGSGPSDRHNDGFFDLLRDYLVGVGVAVLAYDKRGVGRSTGAWPAATVDELAEDAAAAVAALQAHDRPMTGSWPARSGCWVIVKAGGLRSACARGWARRGI
jgi:pimeloyl-ACP methyl ester carboxylesterase